MIVPFEHFLQNNDVKKAFINRELAKSLIRDMDERIEKSLILDENIFSKIIFENIYDGLRNFCDALLVLEGYKSYSHQASISFLLKKGFSIIIVEKIEQFRQKRNGSKYYGLPISAGDAKEIKEFYLKNKEKFDKRRIK